MKKIFYILFLGLVLLLASCGIYTFTGASYGTAKTFSVDYIQNRATYVSPTLSQKITEDLKDRFMSQTPLTMVQKDGDLQFEGVITGYVISPGGIKSGETASFNRLTVTVKIIFTNQTAPENDFEKSFSRYADFDVSQPFQTVESGLLDQIVEELINDIFNESVVNW